jgi:hypothetical protein
MSLVALLCFQLGVVLLLIAGLSEAEADNRMEGLENVAYIAVAAGLALTALLTGFWRAAVGLRASARPLAIPLRVALSWLLVAAVYLAVVAIQALLDDEVITFAQLDATRHILAIGVILTLIVGMANLVVPDLALQRVAGRQVFWRAILFSFALSLAVVLRVGDELLGGVLSAATLYRHWAYAAAIGIAVLLALGWILINAAREQPITLLEVNRPPAGDG